MNNECSFYSLLTRLRYPCLTLLAPSLLSTPIILSNVRVREWRGCSDPGLTQIAHTSPACDWVYDYDTTLQRARQWYRGLPYFKQVFLPVHLLEMGLQFSSMQINTRGKSIMSRTRADPTETRQHAVWELSELGELFLTSFWKRHSNEIFHYHCKYIEDLLWMRANPPCHVCHCEYRMPDKFVNLLFARSGAI